MPTHGLLKKVYDNAGHWGLIIDVDDHGEHRMNLWDKTFAGEKSEDHEAVCDVHNWEGMRVVYTAKKGKPKGSDLNDCWPATIEMIALEEMQPTKTVREMAEEITAEELAKPPLVVPPDETDQVPVKEPSDALRTLTMAAINTEMKAHEARVALLLEVERIAREA